MTEHTSVVVIGGGYAGVTAANRLTRRADVAVTLVNARATFVERIRLHQLVGRSDDAIVDFRNVLATGIRLVVGSVTRIDAAFRRVTLASGDTLDYDYLIYAVGSGSAAPQVPGAAAFAHPIADLEQAERLRATMDAAPEGSTVTVVGAGPSGIETAAELAGSGHDVTLLCGGVLGPYLHPQGRRAVARRLRRLGVTIMDGPGATVTTVEPDRVELVDGRTLASNVTVWTVGFGVPDLAVRSGLATDSVGRLLTDETLTSVDDERIVAAGDSAAPSDLPYRMSCQAAGPLGAHAADTVLNRIAGTQPRPLAVAFVGQCISLGRRGGIFQFSRRNDSAIPLYIGGRVGAWIKEVVCRGTVQQLQIEARWPGRLTLEFAKKGEREGMLLARNRTVDAHAADAASRP